MLSFSADFAASAAFGIQAQADTTLIRLDQFRADPRFAGIDGRGVTVAVLDSGIDLNHSFFGADANGNGVADRIVYSYNFVGSNSADASDDNNHGSNVSSIIGSQNATYTGMAPGVNIVALKVLRSDGLGNASDITEALNWVVANRSTYNIVAVNMSLGLIDNKNTPTSSPWASQFANLVANNTAVVVSSGNYYSYFGSQGVSTPSSDPNAWSIGAVWDRNAGNNYYWSNGAVDYTTGADHIISFSQRSTTMSTIFAPGGQITGASYNGGITTYSGTSQAAPHISGLVADMQQLSMQVSGQLLSVAQLKQTMLAGAVSIVDGDNENDNVVNTNATFKRVDALGWGVQVLSLLFAGTIGVDTLTGTAVGDAIHGNLGNDTVSGNGGDDQLFGDAGNDTLNGGDGNDTLYGGDDNDAILGNAGNDRLVGAAGADTMTGGTGRDVFVYAAGNAGDSIIDFSHAEGDTVDLTGLTIFSSFADFMSRAAQVGADTVFNFGGGDALTMRNVSKAALVEADFSLAVAVESIGNTSLIRIGNTYALHASGSQSGPQLRFQGTPVTVGQFGAEWTPLGAEVNGAGYLVAWKNAVTNLYTAWNLDAVGNYVSDALTNVSSTSPELMALESSLQQDLNQNGSIGGAPLVLEDKGSTDLARAGQNYYLYNAGTTTGPQLSFNGAAVVTGQFGAAWTPVSVEAVAGGYLLAWKNIGTDQYTFWDVASSGAFSSSPVGVVSGGSWALQSRETVLQDDLNGDGAIGPQTSVIESHGSTDLVQAVDTYYLLAGGTTTGPQLSFNGAAVTVGQFAGWTPLGAEANGAGYLVAWRNAGTDQYAIWNVAGSGVCLSMDIISGVGSTLQARELAFQQDLNGDGAIGPQTSVIESHGSTDLVQAVDTYYLFAGGTTIGPQLSFNGAAVVTGQFGAAWAPVSAEAVAGGYLLAWKNIGTDQYTFWDVASSGAFLSSPVGVVSGGSWALQSRETVLQDDLNGDGVTGAITTVLETAGATDLARVADTYFLHASGTTTGPQLGFDGAPVTVGQFAGWTPLGAEANGAGYLVAWRNAGTDQYAIWNVAGSGVCLSMDIISGVSSTLQARELAFQQDLNGDGAIAPQTSLIESHGSTDLVQVVDTYYLFAGDTAIGPQLGFNGAPVTVDQFAGWTPLGAEASGAGYLVAWRNAGTDQYAIWNVAGSGACLSTEIISGVSSTLQTRELAFQQDLNGDGAIGPQTSVIESHGSTDLVQVVDTYYLFADGTTIGPQLGFNGAPVTAGQFAGWMPIAAETDGANYIVAWKDVANSQYTIWNVAADGNYLSNTLGTMAGPSAALRTQEAKFQQDLNGDGVIGSSAAPIESFGNTALVESNGGYAFYRAGNTTGPQLTRDGSPVAWGQFGDWTPLAVEQDIGSSWYYIVAWKNGAADQYIIWSVRPDASYREDLGVMTATNRVLQANETTFQQDINGDGVIGINYGTTGVEAVAPASVVESVDVIDDTYASWLRPDDWHI